MEPVIKPWGFYKNLAEKEEYKIKELCVMPGEKLSLQFHYHRDEHWVVISGIAHITLGLVEKELSAGDYLFIPKWVRHRIENKQQIPLIIIETQTGKKLLEEDIVRLEDKYNRIKEVPI